MAFFEKVKARLKNRDTYNELIKCINIFNSEVISKMELQALVYDIIGKHPDLHSGFSDFLAQCELMDFDFGDGKAKDGKLTQREAQKQKMMSAREKFLSKPISELDLSACERCGPSYRLLPKNFPKATASARTPLCIEHLNDNWVSVTSGSEDYSFKAMRKNQYEEALFRCEDDRFELDMVLETTRATIEVIEPVVEKVSKMTPEESDVVPLAGGSPHLHTPSVDRAAVRHRHGSGHGHSPHDSGLPRRHRAHRARPPEAEGGGVEEGEDGGDADLGGRLREELQQVAGPPLLLLQADGQEGAEREGHDQRDQGGERQEEDERGGDRLRQRRRAGPARHLPGSHLHVRGPKGARRRLCRAQVQHPGDDECGTGGTGDEILARVRRAFLRHLSRRSGGGLRGRLRRASRGVCPQGRGG